VRELAPQVPLLVPGVGAQGGDAAATVRANGAGPMLVNSSRAILYAGTRLADFAERARDAALATRDALRKA
jgi:orotidine-5'-phosphate decarboxylase